MKYELLFSSSCCFGFGLPLVDGALLLAVRLVVLFQGNVLGLAVTSLNLFTWDQFCQAVKEESFRIEIEGGYVGQQLRKMLRW